MTDFQEFKQNLILKGLEFFNLYYSEYRAVVVDNNDPDNLGRLKIDCPEVWGEDAGIETWIYPRASFAGNKTGLYLMPDKNDTVWITFRNGKPDPDYALWQHGWWLKGKAIPHAKVGVYTLTTKNGTHITIDENNGKIIQQYKTGKGTWITEQKVFLGKDNANDPAVLGNENANILTTIANDLQTIKNAMAGAQVVATTVGGGTLPVTSLQTAASNITIPTPSDINGTKSQVVFLE